MIRRFKIKLGDNILWKKGNSYNWKLEFTVEKQKNVNMKQCSTERGPHCPCRKCHQVQAISSACTWSISVPIQKSLNVHYPICLHHHPDTSFWGPTMYLPLWGSFFVFNGRHFHNFNGIVKNTWIKGRSFSHLIPTHPACDQQNHEGLLDFSLAIYLNS